MRLQDERRTGEKTIGSNCRYEVPSNGVIAFCPCAADGIGAYRDELVGDEYISFYFGGDIP